MSTKIDLKVKDKDYYHQTDPQYKLRWPEELRQKVAQSAKEHNRSINADIVARLEQSFEKASPDLQAFEDASIRIINRVITSLQQSGLENDVILKVLKDMTFDKSKN